MRLHLPMNRLDMLFNKIAVLIFFLCPITEIWADEQVIQLSKEAGSSITLKHDQNDVVLEYVGVQYNSGDRIQYKYKMEGVHQDWQMVGTERTARFNNLKAGSYTFFVNAANADGVWSDTPAFVHIKVLPPWWLTWWMKVIYFVVVLALAYALYAYQLNRKLEEQERKRLQELDDVKTKMYTNITHEFRTPLSVIQGVAEQLDGNEQAKEAIQRNSYNLLNLVNQMLDLSKLESGTLPIKMMRGDVINYLSYLTESFKSFSDSKNIKLHFLSEVKFLEMDFDPDKLMKIIVNLLSNAIKFTDDNGDVYVQVNIEKAKNQLSKWRGAEVLLIKVKDTGIGIPAEELSNIFERFYQVDDGSTRKGGGTGIGLAYARELIKILNGRIEVESRVGKGTIFSVFLPIRKESTLHMKSATDELIQTFRYGQRKEERVLDDFVPGVETPLALVVEDNRDVRDYLYNCLNGNFQLVFANDGAEGIDKAVELTPDIIVSDVMMPRKDGFELCATLKKDIRTSHIPIVLLTAKVDIDSRIQGLQHGADAYIAKPFHQKELLVQLSQLLVERRKLQELYSQKFQTATEHKEEDQFLKNIIQIIETDMEKSIDMNGLSDALAMSRTQVYRKVKALTGLSPTIYIRRIRLRKSKMLLSTTQLSISEIAYAVGFNEPAFFTRNFKEFYGKSPKEFRSEQGR